MEAGQCRFDPTTGDGTEKAYLSGGVKVRMGSMEVHLQDIEWLNVEREARSEGEVFITDGDTALNADGFRLFLDTNKYELHNGSGIIAFKRDRS